MNLFQSCQPGVWARSGNGSKMNGRGGNERVQPIILDMHSNPPVLDTSLLEQTQAKIHSGTSQRKPPNQAGGLFWRQLNTVYQTFHKMWAAPPVTWVNPEVLMDPQFQHPQHLNSHHQPLYPPIAKALNPEAPLWFPAEPGGSHLDFIDPLMNPYMDPLTLMQDKGSYQQHMEPHIPKQDISSYPRYVDPHIKMKQDKGSYPQYMAPYNVKQGKGAFPHQIPHYTQTTAPPGKYTNAKVDKPLNPEAKEWVPSNYIYSPPAPVRSAANSNMNEKNMNATNMKGKGTNSSGEIYVPNSLTHPVVPEVLNDFCEITENEISAVRCNNTYPITAHKSKDEYKVDEASEVEPIDFIESSEDNHISDECSISEPVISQHEFTFINPPEKPASQEIDQQTLCRRSESLHDRTRAVENKNSGDKTTAVESKLNSYGDKTAAVDNKTNSGDKTAAVENKINSDEYKTTGIESKLYLGGDKTAAEVKIINSDEYKIAAVVKIDSLKESRTAALEEESLNEKTAAVESNESLDRDRTTDVESNESLGEDKTAAIKNVIVNEIKTDGVESMKSLDGETTTAVEGCESSDGYSSDDTAVCKSDDDSVMDSSSLSYAKIVGRTPPSPPPSPESFEKSHDDSAKYGKVVQPLPKVFIKDKVYPKEKAPPGVDNKCKASGLFKTLNKNQKATSKNFLKELKSSRKADEKESKGLILDFSIRIELPESPPRAASSPKEETILPQHCSFSIGQKIHNISGSSSVDSRNRSVSESSATSVDSLDIDFVDEVDNVKECKKPTSDLVDNVDKAVIKNDIKVCKKATPPSPKFSNVLACILGYDADSDESEEEDDDDEDEDDWDKVCSESGPIDDTWETFGFGLVISGTNGEFPCAQVAVSRCSDKDISKTQCCDKNIPESVTCDSASDEEDVPVLDVSLEEINRQWEEEVERDVLGQSERRVQFGEASVHPMVTWSFAHREARRGPWEQYARDRARFCQRIASLEPTLSLVLNPEHRDCIYKKMQQNSWPS